LTAKEFVSNASRKSKENASAVHCRLDADLAGITITKWLNQSGTKLLLSYRGPKEITRFFPRICSVVSIVGSKPNAMTIGTTTSL
jgi:hypothetical protein